MDRWSEHARLSEPWSGELQQPWAMVPGPPGPTVVQYTKAITRSHWQKASSLLSQLKIQQLQSDEIIYNALITSSKSVWQQALLWFQELSVQLSADMVSYGASINACAEASQWQHALALLWEVDNGNNVVCHSVITACAKALQSTLAFQVLDEMAKRSLEKNMISFTAAISACDQTLWSQAVSFLMTMKDNFIEANLMSYTATASSCSWQRSRSLLELSEMDLDIIVYSACISACEQTAHWQQALDMLRLVALNGMQAGVIAFNATCSASEKANQWRFVMTLLNDRRWQHRADVISYNAAISACQTQWHLASQLLVQVSTKHLQVDLIGYNSGITTCGKAGRWEQALLLLEGCEALEGLSTVTFGAAVDACERSGRWQEALELLRFVHKQQLRCNVVMLNSAISSCEKASEWRQALELLRGFAERSLEADIISYNSAISACEFSAPLSLSLSLLSEACLLRLAVNVITYSACISACEKATAWQAAIDLLSQFNSLHLEANLVTYNALMAACEEAMQWRQAGK